MADVIYIDHEYDDNGNEIEESYVVELDGVPADEYSLSHSYFDSEVDAFEFAKEVSNQTGVEITWGCITPAWV